MIFQKRLSFDKIPEAKPKSIDRNQLLVYGSSSGFGCTQQASDVAFYLQRRTPEIQAEWANRSVRASWKMQLRVPWKLQHIIFDGSTESCVVRPRWGAAFVNVGWHEQELNIQRYPVVCPFL